MHRKQEADLLPLNGKIERTLNLRRSQLQNLEVWKIKEKNCRLFQKNKK